MRKLKFLCLLLLLCMLLSFVCSCVSTDNSQKSDGISIVATLFPQYDFAKGILGEKGSVVLLLPPGADSHSFELTPTDIKKINSSDVFVYTGPDMELWVDSIISSIKDSVKIINLSAPLCLSEEEHKNHDSEHDHSGVDPHVWTNPVYAMVMLDTIYKGICELDPDNKEYYKANYDAYYAELASIDADIKSIASRAKGKCLYFSGKFAFNHFVEEYGFTYVAPFNSCSDVQIESPAAINSLIEQMKANNVKYVFYEELSNNSILDTIVAETKATPLLLHNTHNISKDDYNKGVSYLQLMKNNVLSLRKALIDGETTKLQ